MVFMMFIGVNSLSLASRFVRAVLRRQIVSANRVKDFLDLKELYIYDTSNYFANRTLGMINGIKYTMQAGQSAVLNEAAQEIMSNAHNYLQYVLVMGDTDQKNWNRSTRVH